MSEYKMRDLDGEPMHDLANVCGYNEWLIYDAVDQDKARKASETKNKPKGGGRRRR